MDEARARTARRFRRFASTEARGSSALYEVITATIAERGPLLDVAMAAPPRQRIPNLYLAAVHYLLAARPHADLAAYYPTLGGDRAVDGQLPESLVDFVAAHREPLEELLATRDTQTNEPLRAAQLLPAIGWSATAHPGRPLWLIELGTSAGLLLRQDRYGYVYGFDDGSSLSLGGDARPLLRCAVRGATRADFARFVSRDLAIAGRVGIDRNPLDPRDQDTRAWLRALIWPEHVERLRRLDEALAVAAAHPVVTHRGDAVELLPAVLEQVPPEALPCVFVSNAMVHFGPETRAALTELIRREATRRDLAFVVKEGPGVGIEAFLDDSPGGAGPTDEPHELLGAVVSREGTWWPRHLADAGMHGRWLSWFAGGGPARP